MNWRKVTIYFFAPLAVTLTMIFMYLSGVTALQHVISPEIDGLYWHSNRELGLLENLQNVILLVMLVVLARALFHVRKTAARVALSLLLLFTALVFIEEIDWGHHYYEYFSGIQADEAEQVRNWHNVGDRTRLAKLVVDAGMVVAFLIGPFLLAGSAYPAVRLLTPDKYAALTLAAMLIARTTALGLDDAGFGAPGTLDKDLNEFRELLTYYIAAVYLIDVLEQRLRGLPGLGNAEPPPAGVHEAHSAGGFAVSARASAAE